MKIWVRFLVPIQIRIQNLILILLQIWIQIHILKFFTLYSSIRTTTQIIFMGKRHFCHKIWCKRTLLFSCQKKVTSVSKKTLLSRKFFNLRNSVWYWKKDTSVYQITVPFCWMEIQQNLIRTYESNLLTIF